MVSEYALMEEQENLLRKYEENGYLDALFAEFSKPKEPPAKSYKDRLYNLASEKCVLALILKLCEIPEHGPVIQWPLFDSLVASWNEAPPPPHPCAVHELEPILAHTNFKPCGFIKTPRQMINDHCKAYCLVFDLVYKKCWTKVG